MKHLFMLLIIVVAGAFAAGVRVHPDRLTHYLGGELSGEFRKVYLSEQKFMVGKLIEETDDAVKLKMGSGSASFSKRAILKIEEVSEEEIQSGLYNAWIQKKEPLPLITRREKDSIMPWVARSLAELIRQITDILRDQNASLFRGNASQVKTASLPG